MICQSPSPRVHADCPSCASRAIRRGRHNTRASRLGNAGSPRTQETRTEAARTNTGSERLRGHEHEAQPRSVPLTYAGGVSAGIVGCCVAWVASRHRSRCEARPGAPRRLQVRSRIADGPRSYGSLGGGSSGQRGSGRLGSGEPAARSDSRALQGCCHRARSNASGSKSHCGEGKNQGEGATSEAYSSDERSDHCGGLEFCSRGCRGVKGIKSENGEGSARTSDAYSTATIRLTVNIEVPPQRSREITLQCSARLC